MTSMIILKTMTRMKTNKKSNRELRETGASFSVKQYREEQF